ncbi:hypothetical protein L218DRAFT_999705 [Marasmius fiardii PR-910]|nr:hypothetical protein L218DRAFT_999705 [Marasmius fiardii PR-910]
MKRVADKQITKDGDYDDDDEPEEQKGFQKADESVLAERKIRALPRRAKVGTTVASGPGAGATEETSPKPPGSNFGAFPGFGATNTSQFIFNPSTPAFNPSSTAALSPSATSTAKAFSVAAGITTNGTSTTPQQSSLTSQSTIPDIASSSGTDAAAVEYYRSLRGLNVSILSTISKAVNDDPFVDISGLLERYKSLRIDIQQEFDQKKPTSSSTSTIPSSSFNKSQTKMPTPPTSFLGFGNPTPSSNTPTSTASAGGFTPNLDNATTKSSSFSFPNPALLSSASKPTSLPFSLTPSSTSKETSSATASPPTNFFKDTSKTTNANLFGKPPDGSASAFASSTPIFGKPAGDSTSTSTPSSPFSFGASGSSPPTDKPATPSTPPPSGKLSAFGGALGTKTSPGGGSIGNPVGYGFGSGAPTSSPFAFSAPAGGGSTFGTGGFSFTTSATKGSFGEETASTSNTTEKPAADSDGQQTKGAEDGVGTGMFGPNPHDEEGQGEEDEETVHSVKSKVYKMKKEGEKTSWAELGTGILRLKKHKTEEHRRVLMRNSSNGKINVNFNIYAGLKPSRSQKVVSFVGHEAGVAQTYSVRMKTEDQAIALKDALDREIAFVKAKNSE